MINNQLQNFAKLKTLSHLKSLIAKSSIGKFHYEYSFVLGIMIFSTILSSSVIAYSFIKNNQKVNNISPNDTRVLGINDIYTKEEIYWENLLSQHPDYFPGWIRLSEIKNKLGKTGEENTALKKAEEIDPNSPLLNKSN